MIYLIALVVFYSACNRIEKIMEINREIRRLQLVTEGYKQETERLIAEQESAE